MVAVVAPAESTSRSHLRSRRVAVRPTGAVGGYFYRRPEWMAVLLVLLAWARFALSAWRPRGDGMAMGPASGTAASSGPMAGHLGAHGIGSASTAPDWEAASSYLQGIAMWEVMVAAMMLPATIPLIRQVAFATRRIRRQRSIALLCLGYLLAWLPLGAVAAVWHLLDVPPRTATAAAVVALTVAGVWELTPMKVRSMRGCHRTLPIRYSGRAADRSALRLGLVNGQACVLSCGPAMVALVVLGHSVVATVLVGVVLAG